MKLENEFTVNTSMDEAWKALNDLKRVTPCLPEAQLTAEAVTNQFLPSQQAVDET